MFYNKNLQKQTIKSQLLYSNSVNDSKVKPELSEVQLIDWFVFNANFSSISTISWHGTNYIN
jgi:hypothetical protein